MQEDLCNNYDCILNEDGKRCLSANCSNCPNREVQN